MFADLKDVMGQVTSRGDAATVLLAGTVGFVVDAGLNAVGFLEPGVVGVTSASTALGLKKSWEAKRLLSRSKHAAPEVRAQALQQRLREEELTGLEQELKQEVSLHEDGLTSDRDFEKALDELVNRYRQVSGPTPTFEMDV